MRLLAVSLLALLSLHASSADAAGVLLPADPANSGSNAPALPNLGLVPTDSAKTRAQETQTAKTSAQPQTTQAPDQPNAPPAQPLVAQEKIQQIKESVQLPSVTLHEPDSKITPGGGIAKPVLSEQEKNLNRLMASGATVQASKPASPHAVQIQAYLKAVEDKAKRPPSFLSDTPVAEVNGINYPSSISIQLEAGYLWGTEDIKKIQKTLGYDAKTVPMQCQLRLDAKIASDKDQIGSRSQLLAGRSDKIGYFGTVQSISFLPRAVCNPPSGTLPQNGSIILRTGDKYTVPLSGQASCALAPNQSAPRALSVQYLGDAKVACRFN